MPAHHDVLSAYPRSSSPRSTFSARPLIVLAILLPGLAGEGCDSATGPSRHDQVTEWSFDLDLDRDFLMSIWASGPDDVFVTSGGGVLHFDGDAWEKMDLPSGPSTTLRAVWGFSPDDVYAVGPDGMILHFGGSGWEEMESGTSQNLYDVWGSSPTDVYAVGGRAVVHFDGTAWQDVPYPAPDETPNPFFFGVHGTSATDVYTSMNDGVWHFDGEEWTPMISGGDRFWAVWAASPTRILAAGPGIREFDGSSWSVLEGTETSNTNDYFNDIWGTPAGEIFVVGGEGGGSLWHFDGSAWNETILPEPDSYWGVWAGSGDEIVVTGYDGTVLRYGSGAWTVGLQTVPDLNDVWESKDGEAFAVGDHGTILHFTGSDWEEMESGVQEDLLGVWGASRSSVFFVGRGGRILHFDGSTLSPAESGSSALLTGVWGSSSTNVFAVGGETILHYDGSAWREMDAEGSGVISAIWGASGTRVFAVGGDGRVLRLQDGHWERMETGWSGDFFDIWGSSSTDLFVVGFPRLILHYDGSEWVNMGEEASITESPIAIAGTAPDNVYAVGHYGTLLHFDGTAWSPIPVESVKGAAHLQGISASPRSDVLVVGTSGTILRGKR